MDYSSSRLLDTRHLDPYTIYVFVMVLAQGRGRTTRDLAENKGKGDSHSSPRTK